MLRVTVGDDTSDRCNKLTVTRARLSISGGEINDVRLLE